MTLEQEFAARVEPHRAELLVHCYRMVGSYQDAEDLVQETFLRAWTKRATYEGRSSFRAWLYGIATNACLDALRRRKRRVLPSQVVAPADPTAPIVPGDDQPWLEPFPDRVLDTIVASDAEPGALLVARETVELAFLVAIQQLPPRQRAVLILRDVLDWSASETASLLGSTVASVNSALQRARAGLAGVPAETEPTESEHSLLAELMDAWERTDVAAIAELLRDDARMTMPPTPSWYLGRDAITAFFAGHVFGATSPGRSGLVATAANRQPAFGMYLERDGAFTPFAIGVIRGAHGRIGELTLFVAPELFPAFALPATL
jgi:RNA polymerase sigma-70 factor, ECF subfamily